MPEQNIILQHRVTPEHEQVMFEWLGKWLDLPAPLEPVIINSSGIIKDGKSHDFYEGTFHLKKTS